MTRDGMLILLRQQLSDEQAVGWPVDDELLAHLDHGADYLSSQFIKNREPVMLKRLTVDEGTTLPEDWVAFMGHVPVAVTERVCALYVDGPIEVTYWANLPYPSRFEGSAELPYTHAQCLLLIDMGRLFALNKNEYDISQDVTLMDKIHASMRSSRGKAN